MSAPHGARWSTSAAAPIVRAMPEPHASPQPRPAPENNALLGAVFMLSAGLFFAIMMGIIRHVAASGVHPFEIAFFRNLFGFAAMLPWILKVGLGGLKTQKYGLYTLRAITGTAAMVAWFWAISILPLTEATALSFTTPFFATLLAIPVLGEDVRIRRWAAIVVGFIGAMVILRPGVQSISAEALMVLFSAAMMAMSSMCIKILSRTEPVNAIVVYMTVYLTPMSLIPALFVWTWPSWVQLGWLFLLGLVATAAHICLTQAFRHADASAVMPFDFSRLVFASLIGYFVFDQITDLWTWAGAAIIVGAAIYIAHREAVAARERRREMSARTPPDLPT